MLGDTDKVVAAAEMYWLAQSDNFLPTMMANETLDSLKFGGDFEQKEFECLPTFSSTFNVKLPAPIPSLALNIVIPPCLHPYTNHKIRLFAPKTAEEFLDELRKIHEPKKPATKKVKRERFADDEEYNPSNSSSRLGVKRGPYKKTLMRLGIFQ